MAEALALTAVHDSHFGEVLTAIEAAAKNSNRGERPINLQREIYSSKKAGHEVQTRRFSGPRWAACTLERGI